MAPPPINRSSSFSSPTTLQHFTHPNHPLQTFNLSQEFTCNGCNTPGFGTSYRCHPCGFDLHEYCATCPTTTNSGLHPPHPLTLVNKPIDGTFCDLCGDLVHGMFYTCGACEFDVHPLCTQLPLHVKLPVHPNHLLSLQPAGPAGCAICFKSCTSWRYRCGTCNLDIHLDCILGECESAAQVENGSACQTRSIQPPPLPPPFFPTAAVSKPRPAQQPVQQHSFGIPIGFGMNNPPFGTCYGGPNGSTPPSMMAIQPYGNQGYGHNARPQIQPMMNMNQVQPYVDGYNGHNGKPPLTMNQLYYVYGPDGKPLLLMNQPHGTGGYDPAAASMNAQPNGTDGQTSNGGRKKKNIYLMVGRLALSAAVTGMTGIPIKI